MYGYRPKNKEERLKLREIYLAGYNATENTAADCVIATAEKSGRYLLRIFNGSAANPCVNCYYRTADDRQREIDRHIKNRIASIQAKQARKQSTNSAGAYVVDESKPHFESGKEYFMNWYNDDPWEHTSIIRIIKRTPCFVTLVHVHNGKDSETERVKVSVDKSGEYLSWGSFYFFRAESVVHYETEEERQDLERKEQDEEAVKVEAFHREQDEDRAFIEQTVAAHPIQDGAPVVTIEWSEHPAFYPWEDGTLKLSVAAAEIVLSHYDKVPDDGCCYYKTKFTIDYMEDGVHKSHTDRYDLGDLEGGLINHIRRYNSNLSDLLEAHTAAGRVVSVSVAPWLEEAVKARQKAAEEHAQDTLDMIDMLTDEQLAAAVLRSPKEHPDVARFFLQKLAIRDEGKALSVFRMWRAGSGLEALDEI